MSEGLTPGGTFSGRKPVHSSGEMYSAEGGESRSQRRRGGEGKGKKMSGIGMGKEREWGDREIGGGEIGEHGGAESQERGKNMGEGESRERVE